MKHLVAFLLAALPCSPALAQTGRPLPAAEIEDLGLSEADSYDDYVGRTLLIEFFAHW